MTVNELIEKLNEIKNSDDEAGNWIVTTADLDFDYPAPILYSDISELQILKKDRLENLTEEELEQEFECIHNFVSEHNTFICIN